MPSWMRTGGLVLGLFALVAFAYSPLLQAGFLASDYEALHGSAETDADKRPPSLRAPIAALSLRLSSSVWGDGPEAAFALRLENLLLLALSAVGLALSVRRLLLPWTGSEHARAASVATALVLLSHPLCISAVADLRSRAALLGLAFCTWSLFLFLRGRQDRLLPEAAGALVLTVLGGLTAELAFGLPLLLAGAELASSHRYRDLRVRLRTAATTFGVYGAAVAIDLLLDLGRLGRAGLPPSMQTLQAISREDELGRQLVLAVEKLGLLVLPANPFVTSFAGLALAGAVFLLAIQPGLVAARSAPRLWGWLLVGWFTTLVGCELFHAHVRVTHADPSPARALLPAVAVMAAGLGIAATALSGARRRALPVLVVLGYAALGHANALPWGRAARLVEELRTDVLLARERHGRDARLIVVDPPRSVRGIDPVGDSVAALLEPADERPEAFALSWRAFELFVHQPEFDALRTEPLVVVYPARALGEDEPRERRSFFVPRPTASARPLRWGGAARSPDLDLEALSIGALTVRLAPGASGSGAPRPPRIGWRSRERAASDGSLVGTLLGSGERSEALFDLGSSASWRLADRVKRVWIEGAGGAVEEAVFAADLPALVSADPGEPMTPKRRRRDWRFPPPALPALAHPPPSPPEYSVTLLDLGRRRFVELDARVDERGRLRVAGAAAWVAEAILAGGGPVAWSLDCSVDGRRIARVRGRRVARTGDEEDA